MPPASQYDVTGLWGATLDSGPYARGAASIDGRANEWRALIAGYDVPVTREGWRVQWSLPGDAGSFDGSVQRDGAIAGTWIQPPTRLSGDRYATPVRFRRGAARTWFADVRPLADQATVYLDVTRTSDGSMHAFLRNPEANIGRGRSFLVTVDGTRILFANANDKGDTISGSLDPKSNTFVAFVDPVGTMTFSRRGRNDAVGFYPRTVAGSWSYHEPLPLGDGWRVGTIQSAGVSVRPIASMINTILNTPTVSARSPYVQSLLLARHGRLVLDEYFYGFDPWRTHDLRSAGKSFTGLMLGIAIDRRSPISLHETALEAFPQYPLVANEDARKRRITIEDLISMRSGLSCDDNDENSPGNEDRMYAQTAQPDYYRYALDLPMSTSPGEPTAVYCTAGINVVGGAIRTATRTSMIDFFARYVAQPLQISDYHLNLAPNGDAYAGGGGYLRPRDALKLGQLYLDRGIWNGHRIVSASWTNRSVRRHSAFAASAYAPSHEYGYAWHLFTVASGGHTYAEYMAQGNGGQLIAVLPDLDAVVGFTAGNYNNFPVWRRFFEDDIPKFIIPSLR
ncbi:MAG: beta-lactamase family protein [Candidatus Eremiobacteraeota bacterium]|nr:beta-lactamase family protein [Candidatus Eremiobacteraeota bacterium]